MKFADKLNQLMKETGLTQSKLHEKVNAMHSNWLEQNAKISEYAREKRLIE